jgi:hypothetical protein
VLIADAEGGQLLSGNALFASKLPATLKRLKHSDFDSILRHGYATLIASHEKLSQ